MWLGTRPCSDSLQHPGHLRSQPWNQMQQRLKGPSVWVQSFMIATLKLVLESEFESIWRYLGDDGAPPEAAELVFVLEQEHGQRVEQTVVDGV